MHDLRQIGKISSTYGLKGAVKIESYLDSIEQFREIDELYIFGNIEAFKVKEVKIKKNSCFLILDGVDSIAKSEKLVGLAIYIDSDFKFKKEDNEYYHSELNALTAIANNKAVGVVEDIIKGHAQDILLIKNSDETAMIPFISEFIVDIDLVEKKIYLKTIEGLIPWL